MKNIITRTMLIVVLALLIQSCSDLLDNPQPSTSIASSVALSDAGAVDAIRAQMYGRFHDAEEMNTDWFLKPSALADNTTIRPTANRYQGQNENQIGSGVIDNLAYGDMYDTINDANILINGIEEGVLDEATLTQYRGEAFFIRALVQHHLVRTYGYEPGMTPLSGQGAGFTLGIVLRTQPTLDLSSATPKTRTPVDSVYIQITSDIQQAINLLSQEQEGSPFFASEAAAQALQARVALYQREWTTANTAAENAINLANSTFGARLADADEVATMFDETVGTNPEAIFIIDVDPATETVQYVNNGISAYTSVQWNAQIPTQDLLDLYEAGDTRLDGWYDTCFDDVQGAAISNCPNDNNLELQKWNQEQGQFADDYPHLRIAEMVLIQAEALLNTSGPAAAVTRLNDLRTARGVGPYAGPVTFNAVQDEILNERRRELVAEGHRSFDLKRLGRGFRKPDGSSVPFSDFRILDDIPTSITELNPDVVQNPGY